MTSNEKVFYHESVCEYKWILYNFSSCANSVGESIKSDIFSSHESDFKSELKWQILCFPDGDDEDDKGYLCLYLRSLNDFEITVDWEYTISSSIRIYSSKKFSHKFKCATDGWGCIKKIKRKTILDDLKSGNDTLTIAWKMLFFKRLNPHLDLIKNFESLLETGENSDVILVSNDGKKHKAHKAILMCRSKIFLAMFQHNMKESQNNVVNIEDVNNETLRAILYFIYTGEVKNMYDNAQNLFIVADKYELNNLKEMCTIHLSENITIDNVFPLIEFSDNYNICELKTKAKKYFLKNHTEIMLNKGLEKIKNLARHTVDNLLYDLALQHGSVPSKSD